MHHSVFKNIVQLFIKLTHSFVAIELLTFCKNTKKYFIAQSSSRYSVRKQDWFFAFCRYKNVSQKYWFLILMRITMTAIIERQRARLYTQKAEKIAKRFYIQKARHFSKS